MYIVVLLGSLLALAAPVVHMTGRPVGAQVANSDAAFFFAWTLIAVGVSALVSGGLAARIVDYTPCSLPNSAG